MEATVDKLEAMFQKTESDLDYVSRKLDAEFANNTSSEGKNPGHLLRKISEIRQEYGSIVQEAQAIQQAQKDAMQFFQTELLTMANALSHLQQSAALPAERTEELGKLEKMLGVESTSVAVATVPAIMSTSFEQQEAIEPPQSCQKENAAAFSSPSSRRKVSSELIEIEQAEFDSVSSLVRGRVKLTDVNQTYRILWNHFKEEGNSSPLSVSQMYKMGMCITGQTGEAKLKVLRSLKLLEIQKSGSVILL